jgi:hypothetical protein
MFDVRTGLTAPEAFLDALDDDWIFSSTALAPSRLGRVAADARWRSWFTSAFLGEALVGLLPMYQSKRKAFTASMYDPAAVAPRAFAARRADQWLLIGGNTELVSGVTVRAALAAEEARQVGRALVDAAFDHARRCGLTGAALYVRDHEIDVFGAGRSSQVVGQFATLSVATDAGAYLSALDHGRRSVVRRDWRALDERGLRAAPFVAAQLVDEAVELVGNVKRRHGVPDHPELIRLRLQDWAAEPAGERIAFAVRDGERLLAASFACRHHRRLEMYEIGLVDESASRHLAYVEALVYAPLRHAAAAGCTELLLGLGSTRPKTLRGAVCAPVWAVAGSIRDEYFPNADHPSADP